MKKILFLLLLIPVIGNSQIVYNCCANIPSPTTNTSPLTFVNASTTGSLIATYSSNTLTAVSNGRLANQDGVRLVIGDVLLVKDQNNTKLQNGEFYVADTGTAGSKYVLVRPDYYDTATELYPSQVNVLRGTTNGGKYYLQTTVFPAVGTDPIVYIFTSTPPSPITSLSFVDIVWTTPIPAAVYASGTNTVTPGLNATYTASSNGAFPTTQGVSITSGLKVLVTGQADQTKNGDYVIVNTGSATSKFVLQRISYTSSMLYPHLWEVSQGDNKGQIYQQNNASLVNSNIGISGNITFSNTLSITGIWAIYNALGVPTFYSSYNLAYTASTSGQTIELMADITQSVGVDTLKNGVDINLNGHRLTMTTSNTIAGFIDNGVPYNGKIINGTIIKTATSNSNPVMKLTSTLSTIDFTGTTITTSGGSTYGLTCANCNISNLNISAGNVALSMSGGSAKSITATFTEASGYAIIATNTILTRCSVRDDGEISNALISLLGGCTANYCDAVAMGATGQCFLSTGVNYFNYCTGSATSYTGIGNSIFSGNGSEFLTFCKATSATGCCFNGCGDLGNCEGLSSSYIVMYNCLNNENCTFKGGHSLATVDVDGVAVKLKACAVTNTSTGHAIYIQNNGTIITNCPLTVSDASASCIFGSGSFSSQYADNTYSGSTTPVTSVSQYINVGNVSDAQGNVNINH